MIRRVLGGEAKLQELRLTAVNRRGRPVEVNVVGTPLGHVDNGTSGAILVMDAVDPGSEPLRIALPAHEG
jgi:hypothetical protein